MASARDRLGADRSTCDAASPDPTECRREAKASFRQARDRCRRIARDDCLSCCAAADGTHRFADGFESATIGEFTPSRGSRWTSLQTQDGGTVNISGTAHGGERALAVGCPPDTHTGTVPKASIIRGGLGFRKLDHVWVRFWMRLADTKDNSGFYFCDLEDPTLPGSPGRRLKLRGSYPNYLGSDLAKVPNPTVEGGSKIGFPHDRWVQILWHLYLSDDPGEGAVQIWQDSFLVLDVKAQTLPAAASIYRNISVGCTANSNSADPVAAAFDSFAIWGSCVAPSPSEAWRDVTPPTGRAAEPSGAR